MLIDKKQTNVIVIDSVTKWKEFNAENFPEAFNNQQEAP